MIQNTYPYQTNIPYQQNIQTSNISKPIPQANNQPDNTLQPTPQQNVQTTPQPNVQPQNPAKSNQNPSKQNLLSSYFSFADVFSVSPSFSHQKSQSFSTILGGIFGLLAIGISVYFAIANPSFFLVNINTIATAQEIAGFTYTINVQNYPVGFDIYLVNSTTKKHYQQRMYNNFSANFVCRSQTSPGIYQDVSFGSDYNCANGQYCMPSNFSCDIYRLQTGEARYMVLKIIVCNDTTNPLCNYTKYVSKLSTYVRFNYLNYAPSPSNPSFNIQNAFDLLPIIPINTYLCNFTLVKQSFQTSNIVFGMLGFLTTNLYGVHREIQDYRAAAATVSKPNIKNNSMAQIGFIPSNQVEVSQQNFINITGILGYYCSILGVMTFIIGILLNNYSNNVLKLNIGRYLIYSVDVKKKVIQFRESNPKTMIAALLYSQSLLKCYPKRLKEFFKFHFQLINYVSDRLTIDSLLADIKTINQVDNQKVEIIKPVLQQTQLYKQQQQEQEMNQLKLDQLREYLRENFTIKTENQIQIFIKWVQVNNYDTNQAKSSAEAVFNRNTFNHPIYVNNLINDYQKFKISVNEQNQKDDYIICDNNVQMYKEKSETSQIKLQMTSSLKHNKEQHINLIKQKQHKNLDIINRQQKVEQKWDETY